MASFCFNFYVIAACLMASSLAFPSQYRYYPPSHSRFAGWTVTSQELLALPSMNDPANIVRVAPPADFLRSHHVSRRSIPMPPGEAQPVMMPNLLDMLVYS